MWSPAPSADGLNNTDTSTLDPGSTVTCTRHMSHRNIYHPTALHHYRGIPRPFPPPVFDHLKYVKTEGGNGLHGNKVRKTLMLNFVTVSPMYLSLREPSDNKVLSVGAPAGEDHRMVQGVAQAEELVTGPIERVRELQADMTSSLTGSCQTGCHVHAGG